MFLVVQSQQHPLNPEASGGNKRVFVNLDLEFTTLGQMV